MMRYKLLGCSGLRVSELCLGTMTFGDDWGWGAPKDVSQQMFDRFVHAGGNYIDTSINYTNGSAEKLIGEFIHSERDRFVVATKYTLTSADSKDPNSGGNHRKNMRRSVEQSLRNLQSDYIDILYLHAWDHSTPVEEVVRGMDDLVAAGKVNYVAFSDTPAWIVAEANTRAELMGWSRFIALQLPYSLAGRTPERAELPMAVHWDMTIMAWGILSAGLLTGKYTSDGKTNAEESTRLGDRKLSEREQQIVNTLQSVADEVGRSSSQVAINWVRQSPRAHIIPILGTRKLEQLEDNLAALEWTLSDDQLKTLDEAGKIDYGFPRDFIESDGVHSLIYGQTFDQIDNHRGWPVK
jgi:aryl-alcohol dehydrogenase-like predicted oxidoreductase